eukprot:3041314-Alexandrium_andersonii.AAC.1
MAINRCCRTGASGARRMRAPASPCRGGRLHVEWGAGPRRRSLAHHFVALLRILPPPAGKGLS